jgi:hypothetical protein
VRDALMKIDLTTNTVDLGGMGVFEVDAYIDKHLTATTKDKAHYIRVKTSISTYYFPIK